MKHSHQETVKVEQLVCIPLGLDCRTLKYRSVDKPPGAITLCTESELLQMAIENGTLK